MAVKKMCKWKKEQIEKKVDKFSAIVQDPRYVCRSCARVAHDRKYLCKPVKLSDKA